MQPEHIAAVPLGNPLSIEVVVVRPGSGVAAPFCMVAHIHRRHAIVHPPHQHPVGIVEVFEAICFYVAASKQYYPLFVP